MATSSSRKIKPRPASGKLVGGSRAEGERFYQNLSHVLRTPLIGMRGYVEYLLCGYTGTLNPEQTKCLERARESSIRLEGSIETLMDLIAFQLALVPDQRMDQPFGPLWEGWRGILRGIAGSKGVSLRSLPLRGDAGVRVDPKWMKRFWVIFFESLCGDLPKRPCLAAGARLSAKTIEVTLSGRWGAGWELLGAWRRPGLLGEGVNERVKRTHLFQFVLAREILHFHGGTLGVRPGRGPGRAGEVRVTFPRRPIPARNGAS